MITIPLALLASAFAGPPSFAKDYRGPLSDAFPEVVVSMSVGFAHDRGDVARIESLTVADAPVEPWDALEAVVAHRKGWAPDGARTDEDARRTVEAWERAWAARTDLHVIEQAPSSWRLPADSAGAFHPPRATLHTLDGERVVAYAYWHTYDGGNHGAQTSRAVHVYRVEDGKRLPPMPAVSAYTAAPDGDGVPRPLSISH
ncbi:MAG: hypothetical protein H6737_23660 [Alphaproteobacteria bacterium]|nr:hypothetical protein [Alphaproteobacteria bacterium]